MMIRTELTSGQRAALDPLFEQLRKSNESGAAPAGIVAQVYTDGIVAKFLNPTETKALSKALGGREDVSNHSSVDRITGGAANIQSQEFASTLRFDGSPIEIGSKIWEHMCMPAVNLSGKHAAPQSLAQLYAGIIMAGLGSMAADFGHAQALAFFEEMKGAFAGMADEPEFQGSAVQ